MNNDLKSKDNGYGSMMREAWKRSASQPAGAYRRLNVRQPPVRGLRAAAWILGVILTGAAVLETLIHLDRFLQRLP